MGGLFVDHMDEVLLVYGASFFALGLVLYVLPRQREGRFVFVSHLPWLAAFGLLHGLLEFLIYWKLEHEIASVAVDWSVALLLFASFVPLFEFGLRLCVDDASRKRHAVRLYVGLTAAILATSVAATEAVVGFVAATRFLLGLPAALMAGVGFARLIAQPAALAMRQQLRLASAAFIVYGFSSVVLVKGDSALPAFLPTQQSFLELFGMPVQLLRACCATLALVALVNLVRRINEESRRGEVEQIELTQRANERLRQEIERRKKSEDELAVMAVAFEMQEAVIITDADANILRVNAAFEQITGYSSAEVVGRNPAMFKSGRQDAAFYRNMWDELAQSGKWSGELWNRRKNGEVFPEWLNIAAVRDEAGRVVHYVGAFSDITQRKESEEQIKYLAFYDSLTHLPNRRLLLDRLNQAFSLSTRSRKYGAVMFLDLDNFKNINDARGHEVGDQLLVEVAGRLTFGVRESDTVARLGGDEFVVVVGELGEEGEEAAAQAEKIAEKLLESLRHPYSLDGGEYHCSASLGISLFRDHEMSAEELFKSADTAMYRAKSSGKNTYFFFDRQMQVALEQRLSLEMELRRALERGEFCLYYQPQVDEERRIIGAEVLLRWNHPERGLVAPAEFIPLAEECGLILPIGQWVVETACAQLKSWEADERFRGLQLAVNVSARQFGQDDFVERVRKALQSSGANPARLKLELTEGMMVHDVESCIAKMAELKGLGISFSLDDFGTGYSSLSYLKRLPIDQLKVDRSFVRDIEADEDDVAIVRTIIAMASNLRMGVVAEGVETEGQLLLLNRNGCLTFQGYLLGRPVPVTEFEGLAAT